MKWPIYIVNSEPRVRRRLWTQDHRVRKAAHEALTMGLVPEKFVVSLAAPHIANRNKHQAVLHLVGTLRNVITSIVTISVTSL